MASDSNFTDKQMKDAVNRIYQQNGVGDLSTVMQNLFYGINQRTTGLPIPGNSDHYGLTFFTRPRLNLSYHNVLADRRLHPLLTNDTYSLLRAIRCYLDPVSNKGIIKQDLGSSSAISSPLVDPLNAFIPLLSNNCVSLSGWPDTVLDTFTANAGMVNETYSLVDGASFDYTAMDLTANFRNIAADPITYLFFVWQVYMTQVYRGVLVPYPESVVFNEIDYQSRIYRLVLDPTRKYVTKIACNGACFPYTNAMGTAFNFNGEKPTFEENDQLTIQFKSIGFCPLDPIVMHEFNDVVALFNPNMGNSISGDPMSPLKGLSSGRYVKVEDPSDLNRLNFRCYPHINIATTELEWYISTEDFQI